MGKTRGFTLIELMVTITVMAVIAMMAVPSFGNLIARKKLETTTKELALVFGEARGQAISLGKNITIKFGCPSAPAVCVNTSTVFYWVSPNEDIELTSDAVDVVFSGLGSANNRTNGDLIDNPVCEDPAPNLCDTDPTKNPRRILKLLPLEFTLCNANIGESQTILVSKTGTVDGISVGACS